MKLGRFSLPRKTVLWYGALGIALAAVAGFGLDSIYGTPSSASDSARTVTVSRGTVSSSVSASGNVSADTDDDVSFGTSGTVTAVDVTVGQTVTAGQVLGKLDPTDADNALASAQAELSAAQYTLTSAEDGGTSAQLKQDQASMASAQNQLTTDQQQLTTDQTNLTDAGNQLASDQALGCPASSGSASSGSSGSGGLGAQDATTGSATAESDTAVSLTGTVDTGGSPTTYYFEYGTSTAFGSTTTTATATPGAGDNVTVSAIVTGLIPDTTYLYALVAGGSAGVAETVTTPASACVVDQQTITTDEQTVSKDEATVTAQEESISATTAGDAVVPSTVAQDEATVQEDETTVATDQKDVDDTTLTAPISGTVTAVSDSVGDSVTGSSSAASSTGTSSTGSTGSSSTGSTGTGASGLGGSGTSGASSTGAASTGALSTSSTDSSSDSGSGFVTIENLSGLEVVAGYAEADIAKMAVGETANITLPALTSATVTGTVTAVADTSTVVSNVVTYDVTVALDNPPSTVKAGMTADVSVVVQTATDVLELPSAAITTTGPISTVTVLANGAKKTVTITTGLVGDSTTQIDSGLKVGQVVQEPVASVAASTGTSSTGTGGFGGGGFGGGGFGGGGFGGGGFARG
ncbi:MAG: efflux RND transporter periplasmic adaptor subunit [Acidimicrobiales bacterium]